MTITLCKVAPQVGQHAAGDKRQPTRYEVVVDGQVIGQVYTKSRENWSTTPNGRIRTYMRGYTRFWAGDSKDGHRAVAWAWTRARAVEELIAGVKKERT